MVKIEASTLKRISHLRCGEPLLRRLKRLPDRVGQAKVAGFKYPLNCKKLAFIILIEVQHVQGGSDELIFPGDLDVEFLALLYKLVVLIERHSKDRFVIRFSHFLIVRSIDKCL